MPHLDFRLLTICSVLFAALSCLLVIVFDMINVRLHHRKVKSKLALYFVSHITTQACFIMYFYTPETLINLNWLFMIGIVTVPLFIYAFIFEITKTSAKETFSKGHYIAPVLFSLFMLGLTLTIPRSEQLAILKSDGINNGGSQLFFFFSNKMNFRVVLNIVYVYLIYRRLSPYRKHIANYASNESKSSLRWINLLLLFSVTLLLVPIAGLFTTRSGLATLPVIYIQGSFIIVQFSLLTYHVVKGNYILEYKDAKDNSPVLVEEKIDAIHKEHFTQKKAILNKVSFEDYMANNKPYLDPNLKITDLADKLNINRTYVSAFINSEYDMSFSNFINHWRYKEYTKIREDIKWNHLSNTEIAERVGFGSYRSYTRFAAKEKEDESN